MEFSSEIASTTPITQTADELFKLAQNCLSHDRQLLDNGGEISNGMLLIWVNAGEIGKLPQVVIDLQNRLRDECGIIMRITEKTAHLEQPSFFWMTTLYGGNFIERTAHFKKAQEKTALAA